MKRMAISTQSVSSNPWGSYHPANTASSSTASHTSIAPPDESPAAANSSITNMGSAWLTLNQYAITLQSRIPPLIDALTSADGNLSLDSAANAMQSVVSAYNTLMTGMQDGVLPLKDDWLIVMKQVWQPDGQDSNPFGCTQNHDGTINFSPENFQAAFSRDPVNLSAGLSLLSGMSDTIQAFTSSPLSQILALNKNQFYTPQGFKSPAEEGSFLNIRI
jgi:hypothetical protein